jgi:4-amino-4-deoxy-L-arabinose transferase-like glycosyltransferase
MSVFVRSRAWQAAGVAVAFALMAALHWRNDGLWYGDAPLHAANGLFWWDFLTSLPADPVEFAIRYYARYPVIKPAAYPPLFYILEGFGFAVAGASPYVAKALVLLFAGMAGLYTMAWARRWIGPAAGWAGAFLAFVPGIVVWSNAVMLNVPAAALGLASLYHFRCWLESARVKQLLLAGVFFAAVVLTYFPGGCVIGIYAGWTLLRRPELRFDRRVLWIAAGALLALVPLGVVLLLGPVQAARNLPSASFLTAVPTWTFYWKALPDIIGGPAFALGLVGLAAGSWSPRWRIEAACLAIWIAFVVLTVSPLPARDARYLLPVAPAFILAGAVGLASASAYVQRLHRAWAVTALAAGLAAGFWSAARVQVPRVSGFREVAAYLRQHAPRDAVLFDGTYGAVFAFYVRAFDPQFERRVMAGNKLLYEFGPTDTFAWKQTSKVASTDDVVNILRTKSGCRWIALAVEPRPTWLVGRRLLQTAVARPEFELVQSFPTSGAGGRRIDLYRIVEPVDPVDTVDLQFPSFNNREFRHIVPITR